MSFLSSLDDDAQGAQLMDLGPEVNQSHPLNDHNIPRRLFTLLVRTP
jgi:hypothetical protein